MPDYQGGAQGAAKGAAIGTAIMPGWGTAIGGVAGGLYGMFGGGGGSLDRSQNEFRDVDRNNFGLPGYDENVRQRGQLAQQFAGQGSAHQGGQHQLVGMLQQRAMGQGPSIADMQMRSGLQQSLAQQQALAATGRGNAASAARNASFQSGNIASQLAGQGAMARVQEQQGAQGLLGQVLQGARGQDIQQYDVNNRGQLGALQQQLDMQRAQQMGGLAYETQRGARFGGLLGNPTQGEHTLSALTDLASAYATSKKQGA